MDDVRTLWVLARTGSPCVEMQHKDQAAGTLRCPLGGAHAPTLSWMNAWALQLPLASPTLAPTTAFTPSGGLSRTRGRTPLRPGEGDSDTAEGRQRQRPQRSGGETPGRRRPSAKPGAGAGGRWERAWEPGSGSPAGNGAFGGEKGPQQLPETPLRVPKRPYESRSPGGWTRVSRLSRRTRRTVTLTETRDAKPPPGGEPRGPATAEPLRQHRRGRGSHLPGACPSAAMNHLSSHAIEQNVFVLVLQTDKGTKENVK